jgi:co-chaperonin GroES (HSP10)
MQPLGRNILVKADEVARVRDSGIILLEKTKVSKYTWGTVMEVGDINEDIREGDRVLYQLGRGYREMTDERLPKPTGVEVVALKNIQYWER